ncbi:hypothetical protein CYMTET_30087 [Cymbomonas tetramitiformis]|uniref:Uncharacterized protein n=1 Tax=Cymbomonas tetramitiformis TaxID=36881 RepID=A0AAE0FJT7_9CHLO|nr:hypothetical protein CYMTET_30087 [Cymbomonas tetramitiformis]
MGGGAYPSEGSIFSSVDAATRFGICDLQNSSSLADIASAAFAATTIERFGGDVFVGTLLWVENLETDCATWKTYGDEHTILTDVSNYGVEWFGQSRPMYFVINQNLTIVKRLVGVWSSSNDYSDEITEAIEASLNLQSSSSGAFSFEVSWGLPRGLREDLAIVHIFPRDMRRNSQPWNFMMAKFAQLTRYVKSSSIKNTFKKCFHLP